jgi:hypothetical protein
VSEWLTDPETRQTRAAIDWHLANIPDDRSLRERLEGMATGSHFKALWWYWAPRLYDRNRSLFRPFIQQLRTEHIFEELGGRSRWRQIAWSGEVAASLDPWLTRLEAEGELNLFRSLYAWKHRSEQHWGIDLEPWRKDVRERFAAASSPAARARVLQLYDLHAQLDEDTALRLYEIDAAPATPFILRHLPSPWQSKPERWQRLAASALRRSDEDFYFKLYRIQIPVEEWISEALELCGRVSDPGQLVEALEKRHPQNRWGNGPGAHLHRLLEARGLDLVPYLRRHLRGVYVGRRGTGYEELVSLALRHGWVDLWIAIVVTCGAPDDYNAAIKRVLEDGKLEEPERQRRLALFAGVSSEWNGIGWGLARVQPLSAANALALYERYPEMLRHAFKAHVTPAWRESYLELFEATWARGDEDLADYLASRYATRRFAAPKTGPVASDIAADKYVALKLDEAAFARRAANVLTRIPAYSIYNYGYLIRENRLARLLFERSLRSFLEVPEALRDLVEGSEIHVQNLAYRVLGLPDSRAVIQASENLEILIGTLLRPLRRRTRLAAFAALANAAERVEGARWVLAKAREALVLPDQRYPKEQLIGLIGRILARHPDLAGPQERPLVYRRAAPAPV